MKKVIFLFLVVAFLSACSDSSAAGSQATSHNTEQSKAAVNHIKANEFKKLIDANAGTLIDVRTPREHQAGSIEGTKLNFDVTKPSFKDQLAKLDKNETYLIYCRSGSRSRRAAAIMESIGFKHIYDLQGGYMRWPK